MLAALVTMSMTLINCFLVIFNELLSGNVQLWVVQSVEPAVVNTPFINGFWSRCAAALFQKINGVHDI